MDGIERTTSTTTTAMTMDSFVDNLRFGGARGLKFSRMSLAPCTGYVGGNRSLLWSKLDTKTDMD